MDREYLSKKEKEKKRQRKGKDLNISYVSSGKYFIKCKSNF